MAGVDKEQLTIAEMHPWRGVPSIKDGLIPLQRKVLHTLLQKKSQKEIKVDQLASTVALLYTKYPDQYEIEQAIIKLGQDFVGANNVNYLEPVGWFGSRREGGKDAAAGRFLFTKLAAITRFIFSTADETLLVHRLRKGKSGEPRTYTPAVPMILINGYRASGPDWQTQIPPYNPKDVIENIRRRLRGTSKYDMRPMQPWFRNWTGQVDKLDQIHYSFIGKMHRISQTVMEITELPPRLWTRDFISELDKQIHHASPMLKSYVEHPAGLGVRFVIELVDCNMDAATHQDLQARLNLQRAVTTNNMVALDEAGQVQKYATDLDLLEEFYLSRLGTYSSNKQHKLMVMKQDLAKWEDQSRFIRLLLGGGLDISQDGDILRSNLIQHDFIPVENCDDTIMPIKKRKRDIHEKPTVHGYEHLLEMTVASMMPGPMHQLDLLIADKKAEMASLERESIEDMWEADLRVIEEAWDRQLEHDRTRPQKSECEKCGGLGCMIPAGIRSRQSSSSL
jgi:DNA topoisomerase-2